MIDLLAFAFVLIGTLIATLLQCGWRDCIRCVAALFSLTHRTFNKDKAKAELARQVEEIRKDGLIRAQPRLTGDDEIDQATDAMFADRSLDALLERHARYRSSRFAATDRARNVLEQAAELSPIAGLAGTLLSLGGLAAPLGDNQVIANTIGMAVTTTFYGLIIGHALYLPLAGLVSRRARAEDRAREDVFTWLEAQVRLVEPRLGRDPFAAGKIIARDAA